MTHHLLSACSPLCIVAKVVQAVRQKNDLDLAHQRSGQLYRRCLAGPVNQSAWKPLPRISGKIKFRYRKLSDQHS